MRGPQCFLGYVDASLDAAAFDDDGWFRTGDLGIIDADGYVTVTGRIKDIIIRNAENISALEIEDAARPPPRGRRRRGRRPARPRTGERVCAFVVVAPDAERRRCSRWSCTAGRAAWPYKCPEQLELVDALPRNPTARCSSRS